MHEQLADLMRTSPSSNARRSVPRRVPALMRSLVALSTAVVGLGASPNPVKAATSPIRPWWERAVIYEVYPRSFGDTNGDGIGDINGITAHLGDLKALGVDTVWIAPIYPSPQADFGYDVSDFRGVDPQFGTLSDVDRLVVEAHKRGMRVLLDMVMNHTSNRHPWFAESEASRTNDKSDWYVWNDGLPSDGPGVTAFQKRFAHDGRVPPNNWLSSFGGSAWEWVPARRQFYYHRFYKEQPDLNWRNPAVQQAMLDVVRFWLDRGVDGFRLDAIATLFEDQQLRDNAVKVAGINGSDPKVTDIHTFNLPEVHGVIRRFRQLVDSYPGQRVLVGEAYLESIAALDQWYGGAAKDELHLPMDTMIGFASDAAYKAPYFHRQLEAAETKLHGSMPLYVFDNHDNPRSIDRFGDGQHDLPIAKGIAAILLATRGVALTYYGAPEGMRTLKGLRRDQLRDPVAVKSGQEDKGRDGERTPMQWTPGSQAGFSTNPNTWLPINPDYKTVNTVTEGKDPASLLNWYKMLIVLRKQVPALASGTMTLMAPDENVLGWTRFVAGSKSAATVMINMSGIVQRRDVPASDQSGPRYRCVSSLASVTKPCALTKSITLQPWETIVVYR